MGKKIGGFPKDLSKVGHHEETTFTYMLHLHGYKLFVNPNIMAFHFRAPNSGIRSSKPPKELWDKDHEKFMIKLQKWQKGKING